MVWKMTDAANHELARQGNGLKAAVLALSLARGMQSGGYGLNLSCTRGSPELMPPFVACTLQPSPVWSEGNTAKCQLLYGIHRSQNAVFDLMIKPTIHFITN
jgi:hypothetical protein